MTPVDIRDVKFVDKNHIMPLEQQLRGLIDLHEHAVTVIGMSADMLKKCANYEASHKEWVEKTDWLQLDMKVGELGMHRADVLKKRIFDLLVENNKLNKLVNELKGKK